MRWKRFDEVGRFRKHYENNLKIGISEENIEIFQGKRLLVNQSEGSFKQLMFGKSFMCDVACVVLATYNLLQLEGIETDFFKLACEYEKNATISILGINKHGSLGNNPFKIGACLNSYGCGYKRTFDIAETQKALLNDKKAVVIEKFGFMHLRMHAFLAIGNDIKGFSTVNLYSDDKKIRKNFNSLSDALAEKKFLMAYII